MSNTPPFRPSPSTLADALRSLPPQPLPADFDARVLAALRVPVPWRRRLWQPVQPLLLGASGSLAVTLLLLHFTLSGPPTAPSPTPISVQNLAAAPSSGSLPSVDALLDRPGLCAGSLTTTWNSPLLPEPAQAPRKPEPRRRAEVIRQTTLTC